MRRKMLPAVAAVAGLALVAACSSDSGGASPDGSGSDGNEGPSGDITFWMYPIMPDTGNEEAYWQDTAQAFMDEYPDVTIDIEIQPWANRAESLSSALAGGTQPDLIYLNPDYIAQYGEMGALEPLQDRLDASIVEALRENAVAGMSYQDNLYALPILASVNPTVWNTAVLEDAGIEEIPTTWEEALEIAPTLKDEGYYLTYYHGHSDATGLHGFYPWLWQAGGEVLSEDGSAAAFNSPAGVEALTFIKDLVDEGYVPEEPLTSRVALEQSPWASGDMAMLHQESVGFAAQLVDEEDLHVGPPLENVASIGHGSVGGLAAMSGSDSDEAVTAFLEFMTQEEVLAEMLVESGFYSATHDIEGLYDEDSIFGQEESYQDMTNPGPMHTVARDIHGILAAHIQDVLLNDADPQTALDAAAAEVDAIIERQG